MIAETQIVDVPDSTVPPSPVNAAWTSDKPPFPTIYQRMAAVVADMAPVGKNERAPASMGGYPFRGISDITAALKPALAKNGVFMTLATRDRRLSERPIGGNKTMFVTDLHLDFTFWGAGGDSVTCDAWGQGTDMGDKAGQKAATAAFKTALGIVFCIADDATDSERHDVPDTTREDVEAWYVENGWTGRAQHDAWRKPITARLKDDPGLRSAFTLWRQEKDIHPFAEHLHSADQASQIVEWLAGVTAGKECRAFSDHQWTETSPEGLAVCARCGTVEPF